MKNFSKPVSKFKEKLLPVFNKIIFGQFSKFKNFENNNPTFLMLVKKKRIK